MTRQERLQFCTICENRKLDRNIGIICTLTNEKPNFENSCENFKKDIEENTRKLQLELDAAGDAKTSSKHSPSYIINIGIIATIGGLIFTLFITYWALPVFITGVSLILKGKRQIKILKEHQEFDDKLID